MRITWDKDTSFQTLGRNGYIKTSGIEVCRFDGPAQPGIQAAYDEVHIEPINIEPINSKGDIARARLVIPMEKLGELIDALQQLRGTSATTA